MVQVFGNRILGGIGAPGGGMSEAFGAGVSTALNQRVSRQAMVGEGQRQRMLEQEFSWRGEDREEAKRRQAAAAAAAASSRARAAGLRTTYQSIYGTDVGGSTAAGVNFSATSGAAVTPSSRDGAPVGRLPAAARPGQTRPYVEPGLTFGGGAPAPMSGGGGVGVSGGAGDDRLAGVRVPTTMLGAQGFERRTGLPADLDAYLGGTAARPYPPTAAPAYTEDSVFDPITGVQISGGVANEVVDPYATGDTMTDVTFSPEQRKQLLEQRALIEANAARAAAPAVATPASGTVNVAMPDGSVLPLSLGTEAPVEPTQLGFGPKLGAAPETRDEIALMEFASATGYDPNAPAPPPMKQPGAPNRAINRLMEERGKLVQWTQALIDAEQYEDAATAQAELANIDSKLEASIGRLALQEATMFNAPQRLSAVWSDVSGQQYEFLPSAGGGLDVYVNGELLDENLSMDIITTSTLAMTDQVFAQRQAELAMLTETERAKGMGQAEANVFEYRQRADIDVQKALQVGMTEIDLLAIKRDLGFGEKDQIDFETDEQTGIILVFRNGVREAQYAPTTIAPEGAEPYVSFQRID
jgi:hypothetical protein